ncbi:MAG: cation:proton antiporter [Gammaproteobacteria bacterium]|nr:cation:proton antiporter [Gammaproteobacteria bacterium]
MHLDSFIVSALLLLAVTAVAVALFRHIGLGSVLGLLVAGIVVGPHSPGPNVTAHVDDVRHFTELGVVLLLFVIGLEMKPSRLWSLRRELFGLGSLQILLTGGVIALYVYMGTAQWSTAILFGLTLALSSTAFVMQLLAERGELASRYGSGTFAILLMQDLAVVPLLALVPLLSQTAAIAHGIPLWEQLLILAGMFAVLILFGTRVVPYALDWLARHDNREAFLLVVLLAVFFAAWAMHQSGLSMALGAFIMGMLLSGSRFNLQILAMVEPYKGLLMSLFFVAVGMSIDLGKLADQPLEFLGHTLALIVIKLMVLLPLALVFGYRKADAVRMTFILAQAGEFGFVLFGSALVLEVIDESVFVMAVGVISLSMLLTPLMVRLGHLLAQHMEAQVDTSSTAPLSLPETGERLVLIGGYGRMGHTIATLLQSSGIPFLALDTDAARVAEGRSAGQTVVYGDISDPALLAALHAQRLNLIVLTIDNARIALRTVSLLRDTYPGIPIIARARDLEASARLLEAGATEAYPEAIEASLRLGATALQMAGATADNVDLMIQGVRAKDYELVRDGEQTS